MSVSQNKHMAYRLYRNTTFASNSYPSNVSHFTLESMAVQLQSNAEHQALPIIQTHTIKACPLKTILCNYLQIFVHLSETTHHDH